MDPYLRRLNQLIRCTAESLEYLRGTTYERYTENLLIAIIERREAYIAYLSLIN